MERVNPTNLLDLADYLKENFPGYSWEQDNEGQIVIYLGEKF